MSITFSVVGERIDWDNDADADKYINMSNVNAADVLDALGYSLAPDYSGEVRSRELALRCLRVIGQGEDAELPMVESGGPGTGQCRVISCGRRAGYVVERATQLLALCKRAGDLGMVSYG